MNILDYYTRFILNPIENNLKELYELYYSNNLLDKINRRSYKKLIDKYEEIYLEKLNAYNKIIEEELNN